MSTSNEGVANRFIGSNKGKNNSPWTGWTVEELLKNDLVLPHSSKKPLLRRGFLLEGHDDAGGRQDR